MGRGRAAAAPGRGPPGPRTADAARAPGGDLAATHRRDAARPPGRGVPRRPRRDYVRPGARGSLPGGRHLHGRGTAPLLVVRGHAGARHRPGGQSSPGRGGGGPAQPKPAVPAGGPRRSPGGSTARVARDGRGGGSMTGSRVRVAQVVTRFMAGAGGVALRGALALDPERYEIVFITGEADDLVSKAREAGHEVALLPHLRSEIAPLDDRRALADLRACLKGFDVVHTHSSKAGALGRLAAHRLEIGRIVHTFHGFPFHQFQSWPRRTAYIEIERRVGRYTDVFLAVGSAVAAEAVTRRIPAPERVRTIGGGLEKGRRV